MEHIWFKSYTADMPREINADAFGSVLDICDSSIAKYGDHIAFHCGEHSLTYREFDRLSRQFAAYLQTEMGVKKGDRIALMTPNLLAFPVAFLGIIRAGAVQVNVNPMYTARELEHQLNDAGVEIIVAFSGSLGTLAEIVQATSVKNVIVVEAGNPAATAKGVEIDPRLHNVTRLSDAIQTGESLAFSPVDVTGDDPLFLQYTGGTTGPSKGAVLSHRNLVANTEQFKSFAAGVFVPGEEVVVTVLPLYHVFALMVNLISYISVAGTNHLVTNPRDIDGLIDTLARVKPTAFTGVNTLFNALVANPKLADADLSNIRMCLGGGAPVHASTSQKWKAATGQHIKEGYGLSETGPILTINPFNADNFSGTVGLPVASTDIKLLDDNDNEVAFGEEGEICAFGPQVMSGYWNKPEANAEAFTKDGYFRTGDVGVFVEGGFIKIVDRKKDMVIVSGFNVYPNEVEATASAMDGIAECACIGVPNDKTGEALRLFVVKQLNSNATQDNVIAYCREHLTAYKVPRQIVFIDELPKTTVGKILRRELRNV